MADEDSFPEDEVSGGDETELGDKPGFLSAALLKILKWAAAGLAAIIFIVTVVILTNNIVNRGRTPATVPSVSEDYRAAPKQLDYYEFEIRTRTSDEAANTVIATVGIGHDEKNKTLTTEIVNRTKKLQDVIRSYFTQRTAAQIAPKNEKIVKQELLVRVNAILSSGSVEDVIFLEYNVIPL